MGSGSHDIAGEDIIDDGRGFASAPWLIRFTDVPRGDYRFSLQLIQLLEGGGEVMRKGFFSRQAQFQDDGTLSDPTNFPAQFRVL